MPPPMANTAAWVANTTTWVANTVLQLGYFCCLASRLLASWAAGALVSR